MNNPSQNRSRSVVSRNSFNPDDGWEFAPSGDPALTRRLMAASTDYWVVKRKLGQSAVFAQIALTLRDFTSPDGNQVQLCYIKFWHIRNKTGYDLHA